MAEQRSKPTLILASSSPRRLQLLQQVNVEPDHLMPADVDETPQRKEMPKDLARRLARTKADVCARQAIRVADEMALIFLQQIQLLPVADLFCQKQKPSTKLLIICATCQAALTACLRPSV